MLSAALLAGCSNVESPEPLGEYGGDTGDIDDATEEMGDEQDNEQGEEQGEGDGDGDGDEEEDDPDHGSSAYCRAVVDWDPEWQAHGFAVMDLINQARLAGGTCGFEVFPPAPPLSWDPALACAARAHASDMATHDFFDHTTSDGKDPTWRYEQAGFQGGSWAENLGAGYPSAAEVVSGWMNTDSQCANMRSPKFTWIGVGYAFNAASTYKRYWTLSLGAP
jgi:hypothetical protein